MKDGLVSLLKNPSTYLCCRIMIIIDLRLLAFYVFYIYIAAAIDCCSFCNARILLYIPTLIYVALDRL